MRSLAYAALLPLFLSSPIRGQEPERPAGGWPQFRGPGGQGQAEADSGPPTSWDRERHVAWRTPLPGPGNGSPIVVGDAVYLTSANATGTERSLLCFDRETGKERWSKTVAFSEEMPTHKTNPYGGSTPAADSERVYVWHGSAGLHAYSHEGKEVWHRDLGEFRHIWGYGGSPILHEGKVFLLCAPGAEVFLVALDAETGDELWRSKEPVNGDGERNPQGQWIGAWSTPVIAALGDREVLLSSTMTRVNGHDPETGEILFSCDGLKGKKGELAYSSPTVIGEFCVQIGGFGGPGIGFRLDPAAKGNITESHRLWRTEKNPQSIGSGVAVEGLLYLPDAAGGTIRCLDPATGEERWRERPEGEGPNHWGSISIAGNRAFVTNQSGATVVFEPSPKGLQVLSVNDLGEPSNSTPALAGEAVYLRTERALYRIRR